MIELIIEKSKTLVCLHIGTILVAQPFRGFISPGLDRFSISIDTSVPKAGTPRDFCGSKIKDRRFGNALCANAIHKPNTFY